MIYIPFLVVSAHFLFQIIFHHPTYSKRKKELRREVVRKVHVFVVLFVLIVVHCLVVLLLVRRNPVHGSCRCSKWILSLYLLEEEGLSKGELKIKS